MQGAAMDRIAGQAFSNSGTSGSLSRATQTTRRIVRDPSSTSGNVILNAAEGQGPLQTLQ